MAKIRQYIMPQMVKYNMVNKQLTIIGIYLIDIAEQCKPVFKIWYHMGKIK